jgi:hypothetical protein
MGSVVTLVFVCEKAVETTVSIKAPEMISRNHRGSNLFMGGKIGGGFYCFESELSNI